MVDKIAARHGTAAVAKAYLDFLYSPEGQEIAARNYYRPRSKEVVAKYDSQFPHLARLLEDAKCQGRRGTNSDPS